MQHCSIHDYCSPQSVGLVMYVCTFMLHPSVASEAVGDAAKHFEFLCVTSSDLLYLHNTL